MNSPGISPVRTALSAALLTLAAPLAVADFQPLTESCEEALALSALPAELRSRADVYVWKGDDFVKTISAGGDFHCLVQRNHDEAIIPECVTATGEGSILQGIIAQTKMHAKGLGAEEVAARAEKMIEAGEIAAPEEAGVNYMMSAYNRIYSPGNDTMLHIGPHAMFFAPGATNEVVGGSFQMAQQNRGFPFVAEAGAHSYIVTFTQTASDSSAVEAHCGGQIELNDAEASTD